MSAKIICACGQKLRVPDTLHGSKGKCPQCGEVIHFPAAESQAVSTVAQVSPPVSTPADPLAALAAATSPLKTVPYAGPPAVRAYTGTKPSAYGSLRALGVTCAVFGFIAAAIYAVQGISTFVFVSQASSYGVEGMAPIGCIMGIGVLLAAMVIVIASIWWLALTRGAADLADSSREAQDLLRQI